MQILRKIMNTMLWKVNIYVKYQLICNKQKYIILLEIERGVCVQI